MRELVLSMMLVLLPIALIIGGGAYIAMGLSGTDDAEPGAAADLMEPLANDLSSIPIPIPPPLPSDAIGGNELMCQREPEQITTTLRSHLAMLSLCLVRARVRHGATMPGLLDISFVIQPSGVVTGADVADERYSFPDLVECLADALRGVRFSAAAGGNCGFTFPLDIDGVLVDLLDEEPSSQEME